MALIKIDITKELRSIGVVDLLFILVAVALLGGILALGRQWTGPYQAAVNIDLSGHALLGYCLLSLARNGAAFVLSLLTAFWWGLWAAKSRRAERILIPLLDILQSIPVLGFMPGLVLGMVHLFPGSRLGLELACIVMIFTSQAWNMILSVYQSVKGIPQSMTDMVHNAGLTRRQRFLFLELPASMTPLVWNCMLSVGNGWFFVTVNEAFVLRDQDFRLPGVGSYMSVALEQGDVRAMALGVIAMALMVLSLDLLVWRPLVIWAERFRMEETEGEVQRSMMTELLGRSQVLQRLAAGAYAWLRHLCRRGGVPGLEPVLKLEREHQGWSRRLSGLASLLLLGLMGVGAWRLFGFFRQVGAQRWLVVLGEAGLTFGRILAASLLAAVWAIPLGVKIGLNPRLAKVMQPVIQVLNSYPAPMLFPLLLVVFFALGLNFEVSSILLMMIGTFAYLLFNVIGGASLIPAEQREAWGAYGSRGWSYWRRFILPATLPSLVVGMNTMIGAAWNATIVTEYIQLNGQVQVVRHGLGATINLATASGDLALLTAAVFVMAALVVALNRLLWLPLSDYAARLSQ